MKVLPSKLPPPPFTELCEDLSQIVKKVRFHKTMEYFVGKVWYWTMDFHIGLYIGECLPISILDDGQHGFTFTFAVRTCLDNVQYWTVYIRCTKYFYTKNATSVSKVDLYLASVYIVCESLHNALGVLSKPLLASCYGLWKLSWENITVNGLKFLP